jgi:bifunctional UDP-N-acetylglucosamine pyrophosphorylase/glucosamine-1-phosphate N-acetyltransferase
VTAPDSSIRAIILAAGLGTRMKSRLPKVLHPICGRPMLAYVVDAAREATGQRPVIVYSPQTAQLLDAFAGSADFALQDVPLGTADAVRAGLTALATDTTEVMVLSGDVPLVEAATVSWVADARRRRGAPLALAAVEGPDPTGYGRVLRRDDDLVERIVEEKDANEDERAVRLWNGGLYAFDARWLRAALPRVEPSPQTGELYLTRLVEIAAADGQPATAHGSSSSRASTTARTWSMSSRSSARSGSCAR